MRNDLRKACLNGILMNDVAYNNKFLVRYQYNNSNAKIAIESEIGSWIWNWAIFHKKKTKNVASENMRNDAR